MGQWSKIHSLLICIYSHPKFIDIGYKVGTINLGSIAIEDLEEKSSIFQRTEFKLNNTDIESGCYSNILLHKCIYDRLSYVNLVCLTCLPDDHYLFDLESV